MSGDLPFGMPARVPGGAWVHQVPEPAARQYPEAELQRDVHQFLTVALPPDAFHFAIPNGLMRSKKAGARARGEGVRAGVCDLCVIHRGRAILIELKAAKGVMSAAQKEVMRKLVYCGAEVMVVRSLAQLEAGLRECGVHLRASVSA
jgi:hypothetical protein